MTNLLIIIVSILYVLAFVAAICGVFQVSDTIRNRRTRAKCVVCNGTTAVVFIDDPKMLHSDPNGGICRDHYVQFLRIQRLEQAIEMGL